MLGVTALSAGVLAYAPAVALAETPAHAVGSYGVNVSESTFTDPTRGTPARDGVPASDSRTIHEVIYEPVGTVGPLPTVMFSPGFDDQSSAYDPLLRTVASAGYLVVGVDSPGTSSWFPGLPSFTPAGEDIANVTLDLSAALDDVESGPLGPIVDRVSVAAMGHSDGGTAVANLALNSDYRSSRFSAYVSLSGDVPYGLVGGNVGPINNAPILAMVGSNDEYGNYDPAGGDGTTEQVYATAASSRILVTMAGADHLSAYIGTGAQADDTRAAITHFLDVAEKQDATSRSAFDANVTTDGLVAQEDLRAAWYVNAPACDPAQYLPAPTAMSATLAGGRRGYYVVNAAGAVRAFGAAALYGDMSGTRLNAPIVSITATADGGGYYLLGADGGVFTFGDAGFYGSMGATHLNAPVNGIAVTADGRGYWEVAGDGGIFTFGDAGFSGSTGDMILNAPVDGIAVAPGGNGYWLVARDGGIFTFSPDGFFGSLGATALNAPIIGMASTSDGSGYTLVGADGGVFNFGDSTFYGSLGADPPAAGVISLAATPDSQGYYLLAADGSIYPFGPAAPALGCAN